MRSPKLIYLREISQLRKSTPLICHHLHRKVRAVVSFCFFLFLFSFFLIFDLHLANFEHSYFRAILSYLNRVFKMHFHVNNVVTSSQIDDVLVKICTGPLFDNGTPFITYGCVLHLSSERGIIRTFDEKLCLFELKDLNMDVREFKNWKEQLILCFQGVVDMTDVLPLGCTLKFFATRQNHHTFTASNVSPICEPAAQLIFLNSTEMNVITPDFTSTGSSNHYSVEKERFAYVRILELFQQQAVLSLPLSR